MTTRMHLTQLGNRDVGVNLRRVQARMTKQLLDHPQVGAVVQEVGGAGVAEEAPVKGVGPLLATFQAIQINAHRAD